jgi:hypothetical protein
VRLDEQLKKDMESEAWNLRREAFLHRAPFFWAYATKKEKNT